MYSPGDNRMQTREDNKKRPLLLLRCHAKRPRWAESLGVGGLFVLMLMQRPLGFFCFGFFCGGGAVFAYGGAPTASGTTFPSSEKKARRQPEEMQPTE